ncbi:class I SAM-dependent methyltransferase [uncultured Arthrobacter sp.]|uniref:class I SAM-dependent methyltransferase n=1 Tax=uncultured Arthrobacter sp. TaxID=114050 RepID=UPI002623975C|nr:class I SAM-dependent methyltransferase [uncultured Arthrobacter sp.]
MAFLTHRNLTAIEEMDKPDCDPEMLDRTYAQFPLVNRTVTGWHRTWARYIRPVLSASRTNTLLDVGSGGGDVPRAFARWAARDGFELEITAIDPDERANAFASSQPTTPGLTYRRAFTSELVAEGAQFDVVTSNHVLHHLSADELSGLLSDSEKLSTRLVLHSDIRRTRVGYPLFSLVTLPMRGSYIRVDGLTSIRRSYLAKELRAVVPTGWRVERQVPFRNLLVRRA